VWCFLVNKKLTVEIDCVAVRLIVRKFMVIELCFYLRY